MAELTRERLREMAELDELDALDATPSQIAANRQICALLDACYLEALKRYNEIGLARDAAAMNRSLRLEPITTQPVGRFKMMEKLRMPISLYGRLHDMHPDGVKNFAENTDFIKWLANQPNFEWLKAQPLAAVPKEKI